MGSNKRYAAYFDELQAQRVAEIPDPPCTLPLQAFGPEPLHWVARGDEKPPVWAWISWPHKPAERIEAWATGWNDRVVIVEWDGAGGTRNAVVWRNAVTIRREP